MKKQKLIIMTATFAIVTTAMCMPVSAYQYNFGSTDYAGLLGKPTTSYDEPIADPLTENVRRNKDVALYPPTYGVFSGDIPTEQTSLYHNTVMQYSSGSTVDAVASAGSVPSVSMDTADAGNTQPLYYADGSIGTISIPKLGLTVKVYEGETLENMRTGVAHFESTSAWDGNVAVAGVRPDRALLKVV